MRLVSILLVFLSAFVHAAPDQPYIDSIKSQLEPKKDEGSLVEKLKSELEPLSTERYIEKLVSEDPELQPKEENSSKDYTKKINATLPKKEQGGAIKAVMENRSELEMKRPGEIKSSFSLALAAYIDSAITGGAIEARPFDQVYDGWNPNLQLTYAYKLFNIEGLGSFGAFGNLGIAYFRGKGVFEKQLYNAANGQPFDTSSNTQVQFYALPVTIGAKLQMNILKYVRPFAKVGPMVIPYMESVEGVRTLRGYSNSIYFSGGAAILLDWLSSESTWDAYDSYSFKHIYFTVEYLKLFPLRGDVSFATSGIFGGFAFDF